MQYLVLSPGGDCWPSGGAGGGGAARRPSWSGPRRRRKGCPRRTRPSRRGSGEGSLQWRSTMVRLGGSNVQRFTAMFCVRKL